MARSVYEIFIHDLCTRSAIFLSETSKSDLCSSSASSLKEISQPDLCKRSLGKIFIGDPCTSSLSEVYQRSLGKQHPHVFEAVGSRLKPPSATGHPRLALGANLSADSLVTRGSRWGWVSIRKFNGDIVVRWCEMIVWI